MKDVQNSEDTRGIAIDRVGVCDVRYPISVLDKDNKQQNTVATIDLSVDLPHHFKGTHMSRFIEILNRHHGEITMKNIPEILDELKERLDAERSHIEISFPYFLNKAAPATGKKAQIDYNCCFIAESGKSENDFILKVEVPVTSLCPCSKEISEYGAHNQRGYVTIEVRTRKTDSGEWDFVWIEELIEMAEQSASAPLYALLKREDEKFVTEQAYDNPVFVEDLVRNVALRLKQDERMTSYRVKTVNHESIHAHNAFAVVQSSNWS
jgi:GTP cyclohydrolase I